MVTLDETFKIISDKTKKTKDELKTELDGIFETVKKEMPNETEENLKAISISKLTSLYRKKLNSKGEIFKGFFLSDGGRFDAVKNVRETQQKMVDENPEQALIDKLINEKKELLFWEPEEKLKTMLGWMKKKIGTVIPKEDYMRMLVCAVVVDGKLIKGTMKLRGENTKIDAKLFVEAEFTGFKIQTSTETFIRLNDSGAFSPTYGKDIEEDKIKNVFATLFKNEFIQLNQIEDFLSEHASEKNPVMVAEVDVVEISPTASKTGSTAVTVADDTLDIETNITCWVNETIPLNFPETSKIYIMGTPKVNDKGISINVVGVYVPMIYKSQVPKTDNIEKEANKW